MWVWGCALTRRYALTDDVGMGGPTCGCGAVLLTRRYILTDDGVGMGVQHVGVGLCF